MRNAQDLEGQKIAIAFSTETPDEFRRLVRAGAGVNINPVEIGWGAGLDSLARGDIDGVLLSLGPRLTSGEKDGLKLGPYVILEIPLEPEGR